jgi:hypothetical protein
MFARTVELFNKTVNHAIANALPVIQDQTARPITHALSTHARTVDPHKLSTTFANAHAQLDTLELTARHITTHATHSHVTTEVLAKSLLTILTNASA